MWASRRIHRAVQVVGLAAGLLLAGAGEAGAQAARVLGRVTDVSGNAVAGARITLVAEGAGAEHATVSGETGGFEFSGVAPGSYTLRAERAGRVREQRISVRPGQMVTPVLRLGRAGRAAREPVQGHARRG